MQGDTFRVAVDSAVFTFGLLEMAEQLVIIVVQTVTHVVYIQLE